MTSETIDISMPAIYADAFICIMIYNYTPAGGESPSISREVMCLASIEKLSVSAYALKTIAVNISMEASSLRGASIQWRPSMSNGNSPSRHHIDFMRDGRQYWEHVSCSSRWTPISGDMKAFTASFCADKSLLSWYKVSIRLISKLTFADGHVEEFMPPSWLGLSEENKLGVIFNPGSRIDESSNAWYHFRPAVAICGGDHLFMPRVSSRATK